METFEFEHNGKKLRAFVKPDGVHIESGLLHHGKLVMTIHLEQEASLFNAFIAALSTRDQRIAELERERDTALAEAERLRDACNKMSEAEILGETERCELEKLRVENERLRETVAACAIEAKEQSNDA